MWGEIGGRSVVYFLDTFVCNFAGHFVIHAIMKHNLTFKKS